MKFFHYTSVTISTSADVVTFRDKFPGRAARLLGVFFSANTHHATAALANISVGINGGNEMVVNQTLRVPNTDPTNKSQFLPVCKKIEPNGSISGHVEDYGNAPSYPYVAKIYFELEEPLQ